MKLLQAELAGKLHTILYRDPADERDHFNRAPRQSRGFRVALERAAGSRDAAFYRPPVRTIRPGFSLPVQLRLALVYARVKHLRGEFDDTIEEYAGCDSPKTPRRLPTRNRPYRRTCRTAWTPTQRTISRLAQLEQNNLDLAARMFEQVLTLLPEYGPKQPYYTMFRRGAHANLGRIYELKNDPVRAIAHYTQADPTEQYVGNLLRLSRVGSGAPPWERRPTLPPAPEAKK